MLICEEVLENILLDSKGNQRAPPAQLDPQDRQGCIYHASLLIANEVKSAETITSGLSDDLPKHAALPRASTFNCQRQSPPTDHGELASLERHSSRKRKYDETECEDLNRCWQNLDDDDCVPPLPSEAILEAIVETYFSKIQPWIPFLHMPTFRTRLKDQRERPKIKVLLHALVSATMKYLKLRDFGIDRVDMKRQVRASRNVVTLHGMGSLSVENLQALIVLAFDYVRSPSLLVFITNIRARWGMATFQKRGQSLDLSRGQLSIFS